MLYKFKDDKLKLTKEAKNACILLAINPAHLEKRDLKFFAEKDLPPVRQQMRFEHYEEKRK